MSTVMYRGKKISVSDTKYPGVYFARVNADVYGHQYKFVWYSHDPRFNAACSGNRTIFMPHTDSNGHSVEGFYREVRPHEENREGWQFALELYNGLKAIEGFEFQVAAPRTWGNDQPSVDLSADWWVLSALAKFLKTNQSNPSVVNFYSQDWNSEMSEKIVGFVSAVWRGFYERYSTRTQAMMVREEASRDRKSGLFTVPSSPALLPSERYEVYPGHVLYVYPDGSMLLLGDRTWIVGGELIEFRLEDGDSIEKLIARLVAEFESYDEDRED